MPDPTLFQCWFCFEVVDEVYQCIECGLYGCEECVDLGYWVCGDCFGDDEEEEE